MRSGLLLLFIILNLAAYPQKTCTSAEYRQFCLQQNPELLNQFNQLEKFITQKINSTESRSSTGGNPTGGGLAVIRIPVVVHVLYNRQDENISDEQIRSQIAVLNKDFRKAGDIQQVPEAFRELAADTYIEFELAKVDPSGYATTGITRKKTNIKMFGMDDRIKFSNIGGQDAWNADKYLNIWIGNTAGGIIGYSSLAGSDKNKEGVVIRYDAFGTIGKVTAPYNKGKTAVHEIGHWLALHHIWGDQFCGDDKVADTPPQQAPSRGCPSGTVSSMCTSAPAGRMYMNFMDLTDDACLSIFTYGQRDRMRALFAIGGPRNPLLHSDALSAIPKERIQEEMVQVLQPSFYPNPSNGLVVFKTQESNIGKQIRFFGITGKEIKTILITSNTVKADISGFPAGIYFVRVADGSQLLKLVKN